MAEVLVSVILEQLFSIASELTKHELRLVKNVKKDISSLKSKYESIRLVLDDAEKKQLEDAGVALWLDKLKQVSYDIDNVLDEWSTRLLLLLEEGNHGNADLVPNKKKVCFPLPSSCLPLTAQLKQVGLRREIALKIKNLNDTLDGIAKERHDYSFQTTNFVPNKRRETTSFVDEKEIYGRHEDKDVLISKLLGESSDVSTHPVIIPVVGMGGIGKTTLAKLVFNDERVVEHFAQRIWVCVSDPFDEIRIAKAILESLGNSNQGGLDTLETLLHQVRQSMEGQKFLLVLDDVWSDDREKWEQLTQPLRYGGVGSRVLVTTRKKEVAIMIGAASQMITLQLLSDEYCWSIFSGLAFRERNREECKQLEGVGKEIASRCRGLPLLAKTLGSLMCSKETKREWEDVLCSRIWELQDDRIKFFAPFFLSYYDLSPREKLCFSYCSIFPKDFEFSRNGLIEIWMSQGYFSGSQNPEKDGQNCFKVLTMRSFFQDFVIDDDGSILTCKMHDTLHDFAQFLTRNECSTSSVDMEKTEQPLSVEKVRHSTLLLAPNFPKIPTSVFDQHNLRTFFIITTARALHYGNLVFFHQTSCYLKHVRTLYLSACGMTKVPKQIGQLIHLRYLNLSFNTHLRELPDEVCDLRNLQTLWIQYCYRLQSLPKGMGKLVNLRHLHNSGCDKMKGLPKGIGRLTQLRTLESMIIPENNEVMYLSLGDLKKLNDLRFQRSFQIFNCFNLISFGEIEESVLLTWVDLVELDIDFGMIDRKEQIYEDEFRILEALQPHPSLINLIIRSYRGTNLCPKWMVGLVKLRSLRLFNCKRCETLPPLGSLSSLEVLELVGLEKVRKIGVEFLGTKQGIDDDINVRMVSFPKLELLCIRNLVELEEWEGNVEPTGGASGAIMSCLNKITIRNCGSLKSLPEYLKLTPLKIIEIDNCKMLSQSLRHSEKEWLKISHIPTITIDYCTVRSDGKWDSDALAEYCVPRALMHNENEYDLDAL